MPGRSPRPIIEVELLLEGAAGEGTDTLFKFEIELRRHLPRAEHSRRATFSRW